MKLDIAYVRDQYAVFTHPESGKWAFFENAGGSYVPDAVTDRLHRFFTEYKVQPYGLSAMSIRAGEEMDQAYASVAELINADESEVTLGPSTTMNLYVLAQAIRPTLTAGDEIVVTNQDHEANIGCWRRLEEFGAVIREWRIDPVTGDLDIAVLEQLVNARTKLVCFSLCSNIVGSMNDVEAVCAIAHDAGALVVADGVSYAPHRVVDAAGLGPDFIAFSTYKTFGTHLGVLWGKGDVLAELPAQGHFFNAAEPHYRMNPAGPLHAEIAALNGVGAYYDGLYRHHFGAEEGTLHQRATRLFELFARHEEQLAGRLLTYLRQKPGVRIIGQDHASDGKRAATIAITCSARTSTEIGEGLARSEVAVGCGNFYAVRCLQALGIDPDSGVVRISLVHYNTEQEIDRLIEALETVL